MLDRLLASIRSVVRSYAQVDVSSLCTAGEWLCVYTWLLSRWSGWDRGHIRPYYVCTFICVADLNRFYDFNCPAPLDSGKTNFFLQRLGKSSGGQRLRLNCQPGSPALLLFEPRGPMFLEVDFIRSALVRLSRVIRSGRHESEIFCYRYPCQVSLFCIFNFAPVMEPCKGTSSLHTLGLPETYSF